MVLEVYPWGKCPLRSIRLLRPPGPHGCIKLRFPMKPPATKQHEKRHALLARGVASVLRRLQRPRGPPAPRSSEQWNSEYQSGQWAYLAGPSELARYSVLVGYATHFKPGGSILDLGCGAGVFYQRMQPHGYARYVGVDIAASAIAGLQTTGDVHSVFIAADAESYVPTGQFDLLLLNELLYYLRDPHATVDRYAREQLRHRYAVLDETQVSHDAAGVSWCVTVLARGRGAA
jgi:SAM-dependent methyltransferase